MITPTDDGGEAFAATYDADSEGEGKFYMWSTSKITDVLGDGADTVLFKTIYNVSAEGNWEGHRASSTGSHTRSCSTMRKRRCDGP